VPSASQIPRVGVAPSADAFDQPAFAHLDRLETLAAVPLSVSLRLPCPSSSIIGGSTVPNYPTSTTPRAGPSPDSGA
jgi:hypothetical protein